MNDQLLEPLKYYESVGEHEHKSNTEGYFEELFTKSGVNADENRQTVKEYNAKKEAINDLNKQIKRFKIFKGLAIAGIVIAVALIIGAIYLFTESETGIGILLLLLGGGLIAGMIYLIRSRINPKIKDISALRDKCIAEADEILAKAYAQVAPLNNLFDNTDTFKIIEKTIPDFKFDNKFTKENESLFVTEYDFGDIQTDETSMTDTISGTFAGNPFLFSRRRVHKMGTHKYTGSLTIHWTETSRDSQGNLRTEHKSQTLYAHVIKPKPFYHMNTMLSFGSQAAPDLSFTREGQNVDDLSERALERRIQKGERKLEKQARKALKKGDTFQEMANSEFDVLWGANDRDNEMQFRLMYTPLAQRSVIDLVKDKKHYGDDFDFIKMKRYNAVISDHAQSWAMNTSATNYYSYDIDKIKEKFISFNTTFFRSMFFDFAPIFAVPAYMEEPCSALERIEQYDSNYTYYEHEVMANALGYESFAHEDSHTEAILKTGVVSKQDGKDLITVTAFSYTTVPRVDYVTVRGDDGKFHQVPVPWVEYIPVSKTTAMEVSALDLSEKEYRDTHGAPDGGAYFHGLTAKKLQ